MPIPCPACQEPMAATPTGHRCPLCERSWSLLVCPACSARSLVRDDATEWVCLTCGRPTAGPRREPVPLSSHVSRRVPLVARVTARRVARVATIGFFVWAPVVLVLGASPQVVVAEVLGGTAIGPDETLDLFTVLLATFPLTITAAALTALALARIHLDYATVIVVSSGAFGLASLLGLSSGDAQLGDHAGQWPIRLMIHYLGTYGPALAVSAIAVGTFAGWAVQRVAPMRRGPSEDG